MITSTRQQLEVLGAALSENRVATIGAASAGALSAVAAVYCLSPSKSYKRSPSSIELGGGSIEAKQVKAEFSKYSDSYGARGTGEGIKDRSKVVQLVDVFYSLVTDFYEWGWGQSFHFSPGLPCKSMKESEVAHQARIAAELGIGPGQKAVDCGCGVGGPLRTIASVSGAHVTGLTINEYQVQRAKHHNKKQGVEQLTDVVRGDFTNMPFEAESFDAAYAIEATCHAPKLEMVYGEVFRVLKPGAKFVTYEWVGTSQYDPKNPEHLRIMDEINYGNGLPEMRTYQEAEQAGLTVGFKLLKSVDLATLVPACNNWWDRLTMVMKMAWINRTIVNTLHFLRVLPHGMKDVHDMLSMVAYSLMQGGVSGVFTPMHMLVFQKPQAKN